MPTAKNLIKKPRILALDLLRGYFLVSIILNHLQWYPNGLDWVAMRGSLLVSAAEGFFIISGILLGIVRGRKLADQPFKVSALLVLSRGLKLYVISVVLMLLFTFIGWLFLDNPGLKPGIRPMDEPILDIIIGALSLEYLYGWADFLRLYAIFLIMSPFALWLLRKGKWYIVTAASIGMWLLYPVARVYTENSTELLMPLSWQLIFFTGLTIGYHWNDLSDWWRRQSETLRKTIRIPVLTLAVITLLINIVLVAGFSLNFFPASWQTIYNTELFTTFDKNGLPLARLVLFGLWFNLGLTLFMRFEKTITKWFGWLLLPFGMNSLYVYIQHAIIIFFAHLIIAPGTSSNFILNFFGSIAILGIIYYAVKKRFLFSIIPR